MVDPLRNERRAILGEINRDHGERVVVTTCSGDLFGQRITQKLWFRERP